MIKFRQRVDEYKYKEMESNHGVTNDVVIQ